MEVRGHEIASNEKFTLELPEELLSELDRDDPWTELFQMIGSIDKTLLFFLFCEGSRPILCSAA